MNWKNALGSDFNKSNGDYADKGIQDKEKRMVCMLP